MSAVDLKAIPFCLDDRACAWVHDTLASMSLREKVGQMFCCLSADDSTEALAKLYEEIPFGGLTFRAGPAKLVRERTEFIQHHAKIPVLISANLENGGSGIATDGTEFASQLEAAATGDTHYARLLGEICGAEGAAVGANYAFSPVVDVHYNWRNPIINTRTYGSDPEWVLACAKAYMEGIGKYNVAVTIKHFPGDGVDERDQHLLSSVNSMSCQEWDESFGRIYGELIKAGAQSVMIGHILQPAYTRFYHPGIEDKDIMPASLSPELVRGLLRGKLGFNGMIITDSCSMTGLGCAMPRREIPAAAINAGCDMFLFGRNVQEDFANLLADVEAGVVSMERVDEAVTRILAMKASLGLDRTEKFTCPDYAEIVGCQRHREMAKECADKAITLVKDTQNLLPITPEKHKRVWLHILGDEPGFRGGYPCQEEITAALTAAGFQVTCYDRKHPEKKPRGSSVAELKEQYDVILYVANEISGANNTVCRLNWTTLGCGESPQFVWDIPTLFVSLGDPYHFVDVPMIRTIVNYYNHSPEVIRSLLEKLTGKSTFQGKSPVDPFCGMWGANL